MEPGTEGVSPVWAPCAFLLWWLWLLVVGGAGLAATAVGALVGRDGPPFLGQVLVPVEAAHQVWWCRLQGSTGQMSIIDKVEGESQNWCLSASDWLGWRRVRKMVSCQYFIPWEIIYRLLTQRPSTGAAKLWAVPLKGYSLSFCSPWAFPERN